MTLETKKLDLIRWLSSISDEDIISKLYALKQGSDLDWYDELTIAQQHSIKESISQADKGKTVSHNEVSKRMKSKIQRFKNL